MKCQPAPNVDPGSASTSFLQEIVGAYGELVAAKGHRLESSAAEAVRLSSEPPSLDRDQVRRALGNLNTNALENASPASEITIEGSGEADRLVSAFTAPALASSDASDACLGSCRRSAT